MIASLFLFALPVFAQETEREPLGRLTAYRVDHVETLDGDALGKAVILVRDGVIERIGKTVIIPDGAVVKDFRGHGWTVMPPFTVSHASAFQGATRGRGRNGKYVGIDTVWLADNELLKDYLSHGVLLAGIDPPGTGIPGRTSVIRMTAHAPVPEAVVQDLHLKLTLDSNRSAKDLLRNGLKDADAAIKKEEKAKVDWEQARKDWAEKQKTKAEAEKKEGSEKEASKKEGPASAAKENDKEQKEEEKEPPKEFTAPKIDSQLSPVVDWVRKERVAQIWLSDAAEWVHWNDILKDRELPWELVLSHTSSHNFHEVVEELASAGVRIDLPARLAMQTRYTRIHINLAAELVDAGLEKLVLRPSSSGVSGLSSWRVGVADLVREGLDRAIALKSMTIEPAASMGQEEVVGPLVVGMAANFIFVSGDPLDPLAEVVLVVEDGKTVYDRELEEQEEGR
jgi:hypothetical protein